MSRILPRRTVLQGLGGGSLRPGGRHMRLPEETLLANLWLSLLDRVFESTGRRNAL